MTLGRVLLDRDLADLYGVWTRQLSQQVRCSRERFPGDFLLAVTWEESDTPRSPIVTLDKAGGRGAASQVPAARFDRAGSRDDLERRLRALMEVWAFRAREARLRAADTAGA